MFMLCVGKEKECCTALMIYSAGLSQSFLPYKERQRASSHSPLGSQSLCSFSFSHPRQYFSNIWTLPACFFFFSLLFIHAAKWAIQAYTSHHFHFFFSIFNHLQYVQVCICIYYNHYMGEWRVAVSQGAPVSFYSRRKGII